MAGLEGTRPTGHGRARGLVSSRVSGERVEVATFAPSPDLAPYVADYWASRWDLPPEAPHRVELLADPSVHIVFETEQSRVVGLSTQLWRRELRGRSFVRAVKLRPGAAQAFLPCAASHLTDRITPFLELFPDATALEPQVLAPADDEAGLLHIEAWLRARVRTPEDPKVALATRVVAHIAAHPEVTSAAVLADAFELHPRVLQRRFRDHVGASPKWAIRRARPQEAALRLEAGWEGSLADLAAELGYADHAHLTRDFQSATGRAPASFRRDVWT
ncbi:MAG: AraC family transcriptional regulator [Myxococcales bacterium]|nr:AraC family transcriptional regulator [Myxococcales bacterium]